MPAPVSTSLLVLAWLLCITVTPWAGIPVAVLAVLNELGRMALLAATPEAPAETGRFDDFDE